jgi:hypothetical protein
MTIIDMIFLEDIDEAFQPLIEYAKSVAGSSWEKIVDKYMYMYSDQTHSFFKHIDFRSYIKLPR